MKWRIDYEWGERPGVYDRADSSMVDAFDVRGALSAWDRAGGCINSRVVCVARVKVRRNESEKVSRWRTVRTSKGRGGDIPIPYALGILFNATSRWCGESPAAHSRNVLIAEIVAAHENARSSGLPTIPLARREICALARCGIDAAKFATATSAEIEDMLYKIGGVE